MVSRRALTTLLLAAPPLAFVVASLDGAFTTREENCPSALTVWGVFDEPGDGEAESNGNTSVSHDPSHY